MHRIIKIQHEHQTTLQMLNPYVNKKMIGLFWRGKNKLAARKFGGEMGKMLE